MKDKLLFRKAKLSDAKRIFDYLIKTPELQGNEKETVAYTIDFVKGAIKNPNRDYVHIAEENGNIVGFLMAEMFKHKKYSFLLEIFVHSDYRKRGIASKLFNDYLCYCKEQKLNSINAVVLTSNKKIQKFNEKHGFKKGNKFYFYEKKVK